MTASLVPEEIKLSPDVLQLAIKLGVAAELPKVLEMTREVFLGARVEVEINEDPEINDEVNLAIVVRTEIEDAHELFLTAQNWHRRVFECCHPHKVAAFVLDTGWRP